MKNKNVGYLIAGLSVVIIGIVLIFNLGLKNIVGQTCSHGTSCTMYDTIAVQTYFSLAIAGIILIIGLFFIFSKEEKEIVIKKIKEKVEVKRKPVDYSKLDKDEKIVVKIIEDAEGTIFQSDLVEKSNFSKVKVSRILDKLEGRQLIERKRRGMTNVVLLK
ncbi:MAG: MarR family transcriptional regulator [Candidatus Pacearchaeota archaeon]